MTASGEAEETGASADFLAVEYHVLSVTHVDALAHMFWDGRMYNNRPSTLVGTAEGAAACSVEPMKAGLEAFTIRSAWSFVDELQMLGREYDRIRAVMDPGADRTEQMNLLVSRGQVLGAAREAGIVAENLFARHTDGCRVVGLALARKEPRRNHIEMAIDAIAHSRSAFEQYHALLLARSIFELIDPTAARQLGSAINGQIGKTILPEDPNRWRVAQELLDTINKMAPAAATWSPDTATTVVRIEDEDMVLVRCRPSGSHVRYDDPQENHGPFVVTRGVHSVVLPREFRIGRYTVTNRMFMQFIRAGAYDDDSLWPIPPGSRARFLTTDGRSIGPSTWPSAAGWPDGKEDHPVSGVSYLEAQAYSAWLNRTPPPDGLWSLPREDEWEFAARGESGVTYPWGDAFSGNLCNSVEAGIGSTTSVTAYELGASSVGCCDMAGNVWEFVIAGDTRSDWCVLRGGSFKNDRTEVRSYLRLMNVPIWHRPADFGFRLGLDVVPSPA